MKFRINKETKFDKDKPMFPIAIVAEILKVHRRTLRIYDKKGILSPERSKRNRRLYSFNDIEKGKFIIFLTQEAGANIAGVKIILELLKKLKISPEKYKEFIENIVKQ